MNYKTDFDKLNKLSRDKYYKVYQSLGEKMFSECIIPTVYDFATIDENEKSKEKIENISSFTGNTNDIIKSIHRRNSNYTEEESNKFMQSVIASNVTDITVSGYFYKKLISSCDNMKIDFEDCGSEGEEFKLPIDEDTYNYKVKNYKVTNVKFYLGGIRWMFVVSLRQTRN